MSTRYDHTATITINDITKNTTYSEILARISKEYPDVEIRDEWNGDYWATSCGVIKYKDGEMVSSEQFMKALVEVNIKIFPIGSEEIVTESLLMPVALGKDVPIDASSDEIISSAFNQYVECVKQCPSEQWKFDNKTENQEVF